MPRARHGDRARKCTSTENWKDDKSFGTEGGMKRGGQEEDAAAGEGAQI